MSQQAKSTLRREYESLRCGRQGSLRSLVSGETFNYLSEYDGEEICSKDVVTWSDNRVVKNLGASEIGKTLSALGRLGFLEEKEPKDDGTNVYKERDPEKTKYSERLHDGDGFDWKAIHEELQEMS